MTSLRLVGNWAPSIALGLSLLLAASAFWFYRREMRIADVGRIGWLLPTLRALAVGLVALTLAEPILETRSREGEPGKLVFLLDGSRSMSIPDTEIPGTDSTPSPSRYQRAVELLADDSGLLNSLRDDFEITLSRFGDGHVTDLWTSTVARSSQVPTDTTSWIPESWSTTSPIGNALRHYRQGNAYRDDETPAAGAQPELRPPLLRPPPLRAPELGSSEIVLLSDGQSNFGQSPLAAAEELKQLGVKVFTVGLEPYSEPPDLALRNVTIPERVYRTDALRGTAIVSELRSLGRGFSLQFEYDSQIVWRESFAATADEQRQIDFSIPVASIFDRASQQLNGAEFAVLPVKLTGRLLVDGGEANDENNIQDSYCVIASQKSRMLLIDGRSRWETRYLKNIFSRDPAWQIESVIGASYRDSESNSLDLPKSKEELFQYDLVVFGEVARDLVHSELLQWLREFVEQAGGGLIIIDGARQQLRDERFESLHRMLPIRWLGGNSPMQRGVRDELPKHASLTIEGKALEALRLVRIETSSDGLAAEVSDSRPRGAPRTDVYDLGDAATDESLQLWKKLPPLQYVSPVKPLPGSEVLVEAVNEIEQLPLIISRRYGAGRVLFVASDETWRWRYKIADLVHSRLWNQLARWVMKAPMSLHGEFVSIDTGSASYRTDQPISVRCQLRESDGSPASARSASAVVYSGDRVVARVPLAEDSVTGNYYAQFDSLPSGDYRVQIAAAGFSSEALALESKFSVIGLAGEEMQRIACNESLMQAIAQKADGKYLRESDAENLIELLQPMSSGKIHHSTTLLWQSYGWFSAALLLLIAEWIIRKRVGLV